MPPKLKPAPLLSSGKVPELDPAQMDIEDVLTEMGTPKIVGYSRVASGCDYCLVAAGNLYHTDQLMPIHEHCTCGIEPVFADSNDPRSFHAPEHALPDSELGARIDQTAELPAKAIDTATADGGAASTTGISADAGLLKDIDVAAIEGYGDNSAANRAAYDAFLKEGKMTPEMAAEHEAAVTYYAGADTYGDIQQAFNAVHDGVLGTSKTAKMAIKMREKLKDAFAAAPETSRTIEVFRGLTLEDFPEVGDVIHSKALTSTSVDKGIAEATLERHYRGAAVILRGEVPKGSKVINVEANFETDIKKRHGTNEGELILPPNTELHIIGEAGESPQGYPIYDVEIRVGKP